MPFAHSTVFGIIIGFGPLLLGPLSELYGRSHVMQIANAWYLGICFLIIIVAANGHFPFHSLEFGLWLCAKQERAHRVPLPGGTRWVSPTRYRRRSHWRSVRRRSSRTGNRNIFSRTPSRSCCRSCCWGLDRGKIDMALGGTSSARTCGPYNRPDRHENSSGQRQLWTPLFKDLACSS